MCLGEGLGFAFEPDYPMEKLFGKDYAAILISAAEGADLSSLSRWATRLGESNASGAFSRGQDSYSLEALEAASQALSSVFPPSAESSVAAAALQAELPKQPTKATQTARIASHIAQVRPTVVIPVFPGTNCEYDTKAAFEAAGADVEVVVVNNLRPSSVLDSLERLAQAIGRAQILCLSGGFSAADEPDGSAKFIVSMLQNPMLADAVDKLCSDRDGLAIGICNGFQALIKSGLLPYGRLGGVDVDSPTLTFNTIGRHIATLAHTRIVDPSVSPWLSGTRAGQVHTVALSHGEGRFVASEAHLARLIAAGQVAAQYSDATGRVDGGPASNPNGSVMAIEAIVSPDGRILGKMGHPERIGPSLYKNVPGDFDQGIFASGVGYFS
jgi:phosphoribosylformylglycinamidine synthase